MKKVLVLILVAAMGVLALSGCSSKEAVPSETPSKADSTTPSESSSEQVLIGGSIMTLAYPWFLGAQEGMENWAKDHPEANVKFQFEDSNMDIQTCITKLENMAAAGCKGIVIFPPDAKAIIPTMVDLNKNKGIYFVVGDYPQQPDDPSQVVWSTFVGHDMKALGVAAGEIAVEYLKALGKDDPTLLFISRPQSGEVSQQRVDGFSDTVKAAFPNAKIIVEGDTGAGDKNSAQDLMDNILQREKNIDLVCGHNDAEVLGAYNAAVGAGRANQMKFIGIAGDKEVLTYIQDGNKSWIGEVLQDPVVLGYTAMDALWQAMSGKKLPEKYDLPKPVGITPDNIKNYDWKNWTWLGK
ncbi:MAG: ribose transport system substrate-binding protein [Petrotoga sp.]|jgi:ABC-type sugar transport system substrate-binding protein|nr:ribose transport system substrate-binding protein [Petrotoga sp.]